MVLVREIKVFSIPRRAWAVSVASTAQPLSVRGASAPRKSERHKCGASLLWCLGAGFFVKTDHVQIFSFYNFNDEEMREGVWVAWPHGIVNVLMGAIAETAAEGCKIRALGRQVCFQPPQHICSACLGTPALYIHQLRSEQRA